MSIGGGNKTPTPTYIAAPTPVREPVYNEYENPVYDEYEGFDGYNNYEEY